MKISKEHPWMKYETYIMYNDNGETRIYENAYVIHFSNLHKEKLPKLDSKTGKCYICNPSRVFLKLYSDEFKSMKFGQEKYWVYTTFKASDSFFNIIIKDDRE